MPTTKPRFSVVLDTEISEALDAYWHDHRFKSKNAALNALLREAFSLMESDARFSVSPPALDLAKKYDELSTRDKAFVESVLDYIGSQEEIE